MLRITGKINPVGYLNGAALQDASEWMAPYRVYWEESFDRLDDYLKTLSREDETKGNLYV